MHLRGNLRQHQRVPLVVFIQSGLLGVLLIMQNGEFAQSSNKSIRLWRQNCKYRRKPVRKLWTNANSYTPYKWTDFYVCIPQVLLTRIQHQHWSQNTIFNNWYCIYCANIVPFCTFWYSEPHSLLQGRIKLVLYLVLIILYNLCWKQQHLSQCFF